MSRVTSVLACFLVSGLLLASTASACKARDSDEAIRTVKIFDMLKAFPRAQSFVQGQGSASLGTFDVEGAIRPGLFLHPAARVVFPPVHVSAESLLTFRIGLMEAAWDKPGDGVEFVVSVQRSNDAEAKVFSRYIDPKHNPQDRRWFEERVPLRTFGEQEIRITLSTGPGPAKDFRNDWAVWADPQIVLSSEH